MVTADETDSGNGGPDLPVRIFLRPMGSPLPLGLSGLAIASLLTTGLDFSWVPVEQTHQLGFLLLVTVVPIQLLASAFAFPARDGATASSIGILAGTWAAYGLSKLEMPPLQTSHALGLLLLMAAGVLAGGALAQGTGKVLAALVLLLAAARFALAGLYELTAWEGWQNAAGAVGLGVAAGAVYLVWALSFEDARDRTTLPTLRRGRGKVAVEERASRQLDGIQHEPGVRTQL